MIRTRTALVTAAIAAAGILAAPGCVTEEVSRTPGRFLIPEDAPGGESTSPDDLGARFTWRRLGEVDYDDFSIPLLSPDGRRLVVRGGAPPHWDAVLATRDATPPTPATFRILAIDDDALRVEHEIVGPWLLGRAADATGFLVEEPRPDGSRRLGRVDWETGKVAWLVDEGFVDAFGTLGPDGTLAWSRRAIDDVAFDLMVRRGDGAGTWRLPSRWERSWIDPVIAPDGRTIFMLRRGDGTVELAWSRLTDESRFRDGVSTHPISVRVDARRTQAMLAPQVGVASPSAEHARIVFLHPDLGRLVEWSPRTDLVRPYPERTINAVHLDEDRAVVSTPDGLALAVLASELGRPPAVLPLTEDPAIPRLSGRAEEPILLFRPVAGRYEVLLARFLDDEDDRKSPSAVR
jgi:hypothetical protein